MWPKTKGSRLEASSINSNGGRTLWMGSLRNTSARSVSSCSNGSSGCRAQRTYQHGIQHSTQHSTVQQRKALHSAQHPPQHSPNGQHSTAKFSAQTSAQTCGTEQHSTAQHSTAQHSTAQHRTSRHSTAQHSASQHRFRNLWGDESMELCHAIPVELVKTPYVIYTFLSRKNTQLCVMNSEYNFCG